MPGHPSHQASRSDPTHLQSGLTKELDKLGRTRGSSATPAPTQLTSDIVSPKPQRGNIEKRIITMNRITSNEISPGSGRSSESASYGLPGYSGTGLSPTSASDMSALQRHPNYGGSQQIHNGGTSTSVSTATLFYHSTSLVCGFQLTYPLGKPNDRVLESYSNSTHYAKAIHHPNSRS